MGFLEIVIEREKGHKIGDFLWTSLMADHLLFSSEIFRAKFSVQVVKYIKLLLNKYTTPDVMKVNALYHVNQTCHGRDVIMTEAAVRRCSLKYVFFKISQYSQESSCVGVSFY